MDKEILEVLRDSLTMLANNGGLGKTELMERIAGLIEKGSSQQGVSEPLVDTLLDYFDGCIQGGISPERGRIFALLAAAPSAQNAAPQAPCTPRRSSPGLAERPDSPNGVSLERAAILDETDSGVKPAGVAPSAEGVIEMCASIVEQRGKDYVQKWGDDEGNGMDEHAKTYAWDCLQHAIAIRSLKSKEGGAG